MATVKWLYRGGIMPLANFLLLIRRLRRFSQIKLIKIGVISRFLNDRICEIYDSEKVKKVLEDF